MSRSHLRPKGYNSKQEGTPMENDDERTSHPRERDRTGRLQGRGGAQSNGNSAQPAREDPYAIERVVDRYPIASLAAGFGLGLGLGVLAVAIFRPERLFREERREWGDSIRDFATGSIHDLASGARSLPRMVAERMPEMPTWR